MNYYVPNQPVSLTEAMQIAEKAKEYARSQVKKGATQIENNQLEKESRKALFLATLDVRRTAKKEDISATATIEDPIIARYESRIKYISKYSLGNCFELALQAFDYILTHYHHVDAEVYHIKNGDHVFVVLNKDPASHPQRPETWGKSAVICDPWSNKIFPAQEYLSQLKDYLRPQNENYENNIVDFDPKKQVLIPEHYPMHFHTRSFRMYRSINYIENKFFEETNRLIAILEKYQRSLKIETTQLLEKNKIDILDKKIERINQLIPAIHQRIAEMGTSDDYRLLRVDLMKNYKEIYQAVTAAMQFSQPELATLFAESNADNYIKTGWIRLFGMDTKSRFAKITNETNEALLKPFKRE